MGKIDRGSTSFPQARYDSFVQEIYKDILKKEGYVKEHGKFVRKEKDMFALSSLRVVLAGMIRRKKRCVFESGWRQGLKMRRCCAGKTDLRQARAHIHNFSRDCQKEIFGLEK